MYITVSLIFLCLRNISGFLVPDALKIVHTRNGEIIGTLSSVEFDGHQYQVKKFLGIPYAEPPVGNLRFRKPLPVIPFTTPLIATKYPPICPQSDASYGNISEDCLYLNIFAPMNSGGHGSRKPVLVWIHGGGFVVGTGNNYDSGVFSAFTDTIVVTINYRLGGFGFFSTADEAAPGNYGLWDQHLALRWVHDNIAAFGGDPDTVTIFGESAGSSSVIYQAAYPGNRGLFKRAIAESGTMAAWGSAPVGMNYRKSMSFAARFGCNGTSHTDIVSCLQNKSSDELSNIVKDDDGYEYPYSTWVPVYDNDFVIKDPFVMFNDVEKLPELFSFYHDVDLLIGWNNLDGMIYVQDEGKVSLPNSTITRSELENYHAPDMAEVSLQEKPTKVAIAAVIQEYTPFDNPDDNDEIIKSVSQMATDATLVAPTMLTVDAHVSNTSNTFVYRFGAKPPFRFTNLPSVLETPDNANHGDELFFVFGNDIFANYYFDYPSMVPKRTATQMLLTKAVMTMWGNFAKTGDPNKPISIKPYYDVNWDAYTNDNPVFLDISLNMTQYSIMSSKTLRGVDFWNNILPRIQKMSD